jgi:hypothetical protein
MNKTPNEAIQMLNSYVPKAVNNITNTANNAVRAANNAFVNVGNAVGNAVNNVTNAVGNAANNVAKTFNLGNNAASVTANAINNSTKSKGIPWLLISIIVIFVTIVVLLSVFYDKIVDALPSSIKDIFNKQAPPEPPVVTPVQQQSASDDNAQQSLGLSLDSSSADYGLSQEVNKLLPQKKEVFTIAENRYTYDDAAPLCKSMGAELATYDQVKDAFKKGADWCNYGWVKGQQAIYPTQQDTWEKLQSGPEDSRQMCGEVGVNGGYFDNPELRFGVTCYGDKPQQSEHDEQIIASKQLQPKTPSVIEFDRKVANFKANKNEIGVLPFSSEKNQWNSF